MQQIILVFFCLGLVIASNANLCNCDGDGNECTLRCAFCHGCVAKTMCKFMVSEINYWNETDLSLFNNSELINNFTFFNFTFFNFTLTKDIFHTNIKYIQTRCQQSSVKDWADYSGFDHTGICEYGNQFGYSCPVCDQTCQTISICADIQAKIITVRELVNSTSRTFVHSNLMLKYCKSPPSPKLRINGVICRAPSVWILLILLIVFCQF